MVDKEKLEVLIERLSMRDKDPDQPYNFVVRTKYDNDTTDFTIGTGSGAEKLRDIIESAKRVKAPRVEITLYKGKNGTTPIETTIFQITGTKKSREGKPAEESTTIKKINEMLDRFSEERKGLLGTIEQQQKAIDAGNTAMNLELINLKHNLEIEKLTQQREELSKRLVETEAELTEIQGAFEELTQAVEKNEKILNKTDLYTNLLGIAIKNMPGLQKIAGPLAGIFTGDESTAALPSETGSQEGLAPNPKFNRILSFCQGLSEEDLDLMLDMVELMERDPSLLKNFVEMARS